MNNSFLSDPRFAGIEENQKRIWLSSPTMYGDEQRWINEAIQTNWVSTVGANIDAVERQIAEITGVQYAVALNTGTAALHLATRLAGEKLYGRARPQEGTLREHRVFCSDLNFNASINPVTYEQGEAIFIDAEPDTWNMDPEALEKAFELYPDVKLVVIVQLYGTPGKWDELKAICSAHGALIVEDAAEALGAKYCMKGQWMEAGALGDYGCVSFNGNKIITGSCGGMFLTNSLEDAEKARKWAAQSREKAPWYQHEEVGFNYRMSNIVAGVLRGQTPHLNAHIAQKKAIYERYKRGLADLPVKMNPFDEQHSAPNFWLSCLTIDEDFMAHQTRGEREFLYSSEPGKSSPQEILDALGAFNVEGRPIWKPMHLQPIYKKHAFVTARGHDAAGAPGVEVGTDIFKRGLCLPSDNKMTAEQQDRIIEIIHRCFHRGKMAENHFGS